MNYLRGCTVIEGNLAIAFGLYSLDENSKERSPPLTISFPELREITDYLLIYDSKNLPKLTNVFPNLTVIRGNKLLEVSFCVGPLAFNAVALADRDL